CPEKALARFTATPTAFEPRPGKMDGDGEVAYSSVRHDRSDMSIGLLPQITAVTCRHKQKSRRGGNIARCPATSAYSLTNPPAGPGCSSSSHPTTSIEF